MRDEAGRRRRQRASAARLASRTSAQTAHTGAAQGIALCLLSDEAAAQQPQLRQQAGAPTTNPPASGAAPWWRPSPQQQQAHAQQQQQQHQHQQQPQPQPNGAWLDGVGAAELAAAELAGAWQLGGWPAHGSATPLAAAGAFDDASGSWRIGTAVASCSVACREPESDPLVAAAQAAVAAAAAAVRPGTVACVGDVHTLVGACNGDALLLLGHGSTTITAGDGRRCPARRRASSCSSTGASLGDVAVMTDEDSVSDDGSSGASFVDAADAAGSSCHSMIVLCADDGAGKQQKEQEQQRQEQQHHRQQQQQRPQRVALMTLPRPVPVIQLLSCSALLSPADGSSAALVHQLSNNSCLYIGSAAMVQVHGMASGGGLGSVAGAPGCKLVACQAGTAPHACGQGQQQLMYLLDV